MDENWKKRFRAPSVRWFEQAKGRPERGMAVTNLAGVEQLYACELPSGQLRQLTDEPEGVRFGTIAPNGEYIYYFLDEKGNEIGHWARIPFAGGAPQVITPSLAPYASFGIKLSRNGKRCGFIAAGAEGFRTYVVDLDGGDQPGEPQQIYASRSFVGSVTLSSRGEVIVAASTERTGMQHFELLACDAASGERLRSLWDGPEASLTPVLFSPLPGDLRLLATSNRSGFSRPLIWNAGSGERQDLDLPGVAGDVDGVDWSPDGETLLLRQLYQAKQQFYLYDLASGELSRLEAPAGSYDFYGGTGVAFTPEGEILAVWQDAAHPSQLIALDRQSGKKTRTVLQAGETPPGRPWQPVTFPSTDGTLIQGWLAKPAGEGPFPTILHTHGGPESVMVERFMPDSQAWLDHGYAFLTINYRGSTNFGRKFQEQIWGNLGYWEVEDLEGAYRFLVREGIARPEAVFLTGWSYGGYLTLLGLGRKAELWAGGMAGIAIADWAIQYEDSAGTLRGYQAAMFGGTPEEKPEQYRASSPITYVENVRAPVLVIQGRNDTRCPARPMEMYEAKLKALGKPVEVHWFDAGHGSLSVEESIEHQQIMLDFARRVLEGE